MNKADLETVQVLAAFIHKAREDGCDDLTLAGIIFLIAEKSFNKAIEDAMPTIIDSCQTGGDYA
jgi:hypothetical protein